MNKVFENAKDQHVRKTYVYANESLYAYADPECTIKIDSETLKDLYIKGILISAYNGAEESLLYTPIAIGFFYGFSALVYLTPGGNPNSVVVKSLYCKEFVGEG